MLFVEGAGLTVMVDSALDGRGRGLYCEGDASTIVRGPLGTLGRDGKTFEGAEVVCLTWRGMFS